MELKYPDHHCEYSPTSAHWYLSMLDGVWQCKYCLTAKWLPRDYEDAIQFGQDINRLGIQGAYTKWLQHRPNTKRLLVELIKGCNYARATNP